MPNKNTTSEIRVRANVSVIQGGKVLLTPHFIEDGSIIWYIPGGKVEFLEKIEDAAKREFKEETGIDVSVGKLIDVYETIESDKPWHSIALTYKGHITGGKLKVEKHPKYGLKEPRWFSLEELKNIKYRPPKAVKKAFKET